MSGHSDDVPRGFHGLSPHRQLRQLCDRISGIPTGQRQAWVTRLVPTDRVGREALGHILRQLPSPAETHPAALHDSQLIPVLRTIVEETAPTLDRHDPVHARLLGHVGHLFESTGETERAAVLLMLALKLDRNAHGHDSPAAIASAWRLAEFRMRWLMFEPAAKIYLEVLRAVMSVDGGASPRVVQIAAACWEAVDARDGIGSHFDLESRVQALSLLHGRDPRLLDIYIRRELFDVPAIGLARDLGLELVDQNRMHHEARGVVAEVERSLRDRWSILTGI